MYRVGIYGTREAMDAVDTCPIKWFDTVEDAYSQLADWVETLEKHYDTLTEESQSTVWAYIEIRHGHGMVDYKYDSLIWHAENYERQRNSAR